jgi:hypothetical protein
VSFEEWPFPIRVSEDGSVIILGHDREGNLIRHWLRPRLAREYAARIVQAADQAQYGIVPIHEESQL